MTKAIRLEDNDTSILILDGIQVVRLTMDEIDDTPCWRIAVYYEGKTGYFFYYDSKVKAEKEMTYILSWFDNGG